MYKITSKCHIFQCVRVEFLQAFIVMRKHRINMNLMFDHDPDSFMQNVNSFISQIENPTHLNLFISDLQ